jgi:hypothetical protein
VGDIVVYRVKVLSSKGEGLWAKLELKCSKLLKPNVAQLANADTGVVVRKAQVCGLIRYHKNGGFQDDNN